MKMIGLEKRFVNSPAHGRAVAANATELLNHLEIEPGWRYLDVGCGVGHAARAIAEHGTLDVTAVDEYGREFDKVTYRRRVHAAVR